MADRPPVKPFENLTFLRIVAPLEMLPRSAAVQGREPLLGELDAVALPTVADEEILTHRDFPLTAVSGAPDTPPPNRGPGRTAFVRPGWGGRIGSRRNRGAGHGRIALEPREAHSYHFTGFGRTGVWFAAKRHRVEAGILVFVKGITSGCLPLDRIIVSRPILDAMTSVPYGDRWIHAYTYPGQPTCCAVGSQNLKILEKEALVENAAKMVGDALGRDETVSHLKAVGEVCGKGLMVVVGLVADRRYCPGGDCVGAAGAGVIGKRGALTEVVVRYFSGSETRKEAIGTNWALAGQTSGVCVRDQ